jgi:aminoglycoside phosphotransferase (APT) family kinase protein
MGDEAQAVVAREVVDLDRVRGWMDERALGEGPLEGAELIAGGTQNVLLRFRRGARFFVLRRPPPHKRANSDETMRREARVLDALAGSDVPHPALIAACPETDVIGAAFYLMEPVDGFNPSLGLPEPHRSDIAMQHRMGLAMADAIASLGALDPAARGVLDLGKVDGWMERQVPRWRAQLDGYRQLEGYGGPDIPGVDEVGRWLDDHRPAEFRAGIIHGDFHFSNVMFRRDAPELAAVVDWELATIGEPLLDLGHLLATWPAGAARGNDVAPPPGVGPGAAFLPGALPSADDIVARYAERSGRDLSAVPWFRVLACYRLGIILEGTNARADAGLAPRATGDALHAMTLSLFEQAHQLIGG